jgi:DNA-binding protein HU-beta
MTKTELIDAISREVGLSKVDSGNVLKTVLDSIATALQEGQDVSLPGFGTFTVRFRPERQGRNPKTGEAIVIKAARMPAFKPGKLLKEAVQSDAVSAEAAA